MIVEVHFELRNAGDKKRDLLEAKAYTLSAFTIREQLDPCDDICERLQSSLRIFTRLRTHWSKLKSTGTCFQTASMSPITPDPPERHPQNVGAGLAGEGQV
jgi:hypothetical protein